MEKRAEPFPKPQARHPDKPASTPDSNSGQSPPSPPPSPMKGFWMALAAALLLSIPGYFAAAYFVQSFNEETTDDAFVDGRIVTIAPKVAGQVLSVPVESNQEVRQGDLLAEIDPKDFKLRLAQKQASYQTAIANQNTVRAGFALVRARVTTAEASAKQMAAEAAAAKAVADRAQTDLERNQPLLDRGVISPQELDASKATSITAAANYRAAQEKAAGETSKLAEAQAQLEAARTLLETSGAQIHQTQLDIQSAELDLSYARIVAPAAGRVTRKSIEAGAYVQVGQQLMALVTTDVWIIANFKETQLAHMRPGHPVDLEIAAYPGRIYPGHVDSIQAGSGARFSLLPPENAVGNYVKIVQRVPVKIRFNNLPTDLLLGPGMSVTPWVHVRQVHISPLLLWLLSLSCMLALAGLVWLIIVKRRAKPNER